MHKTYQALVVPLAVAASLFTNISPSTADLPPLIPREILFGNPERANPQISPDGKFLTYLAPDKNNVLQVWMRTVGKKDDRILTAERKRGIREYFWTYDGQQLIYRQDRDGDENWNFYAVNVKKPGKAIRNLTPFKGIQAQKIALDPNFPDEILVGINKQDPRKHDAYRIDLNTGNAKLVTKNPGNIIDFVADPQFQIRAAIATTPNGGSELLTRQATKAWQTRREWNPDEQVNTVTFRDGKTLYITGNDNTNAIRLSTLNLATGKETVLAQDRQYDIDDLFVHPVKRQVQAVGFYRDKLEWQVLDQSITTDFEAIAKIRKGEFSIVDRDLADKTWLVEYNTDDGPIYYYTYDRPSKKSQLLFSSQPKLEGLSLAQMQPISYQSRDKLTIHGYLTTPVGIPAKNLPTVLLVHGGPWARDTWGYNPMVQWLANRGYAVLQVNFRGSSGYGKQFLNAGNREWGGKMHDDLIDGVNWMIKQGIADPKKVAIMGGSYGGYATLAGLTFTPDVFAAGVDLVGPSNLLTLLNSFPPYWAPMKQMFYHRVGNPQTEAQFLKSRSPLFFADRIEAPLLIGQGANDPRVKQAESEQIVAAMRKANKPVQYIVYTDEGHGFARPANRLHFFAQAEEFLGKYLGGRVEPMGKIPGHSAVIK